MAKGGDLWDDSALVDAFDYAMSTYKKMHKKKNQVSGPDNGDVITVRDNSDTETKDGNAAASSMPIANGLTAVEECNDLSLVEEDLAPEISADGGSQGITFECHSTAEVDAYNQLLGQYYELEASRQKSLEQLNRYGDMSYQNYEASQGDPGLEMAGASSIPQDHVSACQVACPVDICCCCPYDCPTSAEPCRLSSCLVGCGARIQYHRNDATGNCGVTRTATEAIGKAMSSLKVKAPTSEDKDGEGDKSFSGGTDITDVMNAWYSAGFYTGKYLAEQSIREKTRV